LLGTSGRETICAPIVEPSGRDEWLRAFNGGRAGFQQSVSWWSWQHTQK